MQKQTNHVRSETHAPVHVNLDRNYPSSVSDDPWSLAKIGPGPLRPRIVTIMPEGVCQGESM